MRRIHTQIITAIISILLLTSCAHFTGMPSVALLLPKKFTQAPSTSTTQTAAKLTQNWWKNTNDALLKTLIRQIETDNLSLQQAKFRLLSARAESPALDYLPALNSSGSLQYNRLLKGASSFSSTGLPTQNGTHKTTGYYNVQLDASWELPIYGQYSQEEKRVAATIALAEADIDAVRQSVISEVIRLYAKMRELQQEKYLLTRILISQQKIAAYQAIKYKAGLISESEYNTNKRGFLSVQNEVTTVSSELVTTTQQLAKALGKTMPDTRWQIPASLPVFTVPPLADTPLDVLRNRPDIRKAESAVLAAAADFELAKSDRYPKLSLSGTLSQLDNIVGAPLLGKTIQLSGVPTLSLPLFDWGKRMAAAKKQDAKLSESAAAYRETLTTALTEVEAFLAAYKAAHMQEKTTLANAQLAKANSTHATLLFKHGINDGIAAENAAIEAARAENNHLQARFNSIERLTTLTKALGAGAPH